MVSAGQRWQLADAHGPYDLLLNQSQTIDVFSASPDLRPAILRRAKCLQTTASGASLSGADLRGVLWYAKPATLAHADLEDAAHVGSYMTGTDFTQAYLAGSDLSGSVLVQATFRGCTVGTGSSGRAFSLEGALLHGADFTGGTLLGAILVDPAVATERSAAVHPAAVRRLEPDDRRTADACPAVRRGRTSLGSNPTVSKVQQWLLDDSKNSDPDMPATYRVQPVSGQLAVYDAAGGGMLFSLPSSDASLFSGRTVPQALVNAFAQTGIYTLAPNAPITAQTDWEIIVGTDPVGTSVGTYGRMRVFADSTALPVYGVVLVTPHGWPSVTGDLAFGPTVEITTALNPQSIGPSGEPRAWVDQGLITLEQLMTARPGQP
jgi:Pentapeptide repeats (8 copies)